MDSVIKAAFVYAILWAIVRLSGRRTLGQMTAFDLVLFMLISGAMQRGLTGEDYSLTNALLIVITFVGADILLSLAELRSPFVKRLLTGTPMLIVENGKPLAWRLRRARLTEDEVMASARLRYGIERMEQIKYAVLETTGNISIVPAPGSKPRKRRAK